MTRIVALTAYSRARVAECADNALTPSYYTYKTQTDRRLALDRTWPLQTTAC